MQNYIWNCRRSKCVRHHLQWMLSTDRSESIWFLVIKIEAFRFPFSSLSLVDLLRFVSIHLCSYRLQYGINWCERMPDMLSPLHLIRAAAFDAFCCRKQRSARILELTVNIYSLAVALVGFRPLPFSYIFIFIALANTDVAFHFVSIIIVIIVQVREGEKRIMSDVSKRCRQRTTTELFSEMQCVIRLWIFSELRLAAS